MIKTALITGAASGLGYELTLLLAEDDYNLILVDIDAEKLNEVEAKIKQAYECEVDVLVKDLSKPNVAIEIVVTIQPVVKKKHSCEQF